MKNKILPKDPTELLAALAFHFTSELGLPEEIVLKKIWDEWEKADDEMKFKILASAYKYL